MNITDQIDAFFGSASEAEMAKLLKDSKFSELNAVGWNIIRPDELALGSMVILSGEYVADQVGALGAKPALEDFGTVSLHGNCEESPLAA